MLGISPEEGNSKLLRNVGFYQPVYMTPNPRTLSSLLNTVQMIFGFKLLTDNPKQKMVGKWLYLLPPTTSCTIITLSALDLLQMSPSHSHLNAFSDN
jgi:hypothetical protein